MEEEKDLYRIQYKDNTFQLVNWTEEQLKYVYSQIVMEEKVVLIDKCIYKLDDIRAITYLPPEVLSDTEKDEPLIETPEGTYEKELYDSLVSMGIIPPVKGGNE